MNKEGLYLIYVNLLGKDWKEDYIYEFIFSDTTEDIDGEDWDLYPASGQPSPPRKILTKAVGALTTGIKMNVIQNSDTFAVWDSIDGVCALAWEDLLEYEEYPERRLVFQFGEEIKSVEDKLYEKDLVLDYKVKHNGPKKENSEQVEES
jgi:hypothetical protein